MASWKKEGMMELEEDAREWTIDMAGPNGKT
jgi:hypothetical protein